MRMQRELTGIKNIVGDLCFMYFKESMGCTQFCMKLASGFAGLDSSDGIG
jgi:hypothetical protein